MLLSHWIFIQRIKTWTKQSGVKNNLLSSSVKVNCNMQCAESLETIGYVRDASSFLLVFAEATEMATSGAPVCVVTIRYRNQVPTDTTPAYTVDRDLLARHYSTWLVRCREKAFDGMFNKWHRPKLTRRPAGKLFSTPLLFQTLGTSGLQITTRLLLCTLK